METRGTVVTLVYSCSTSAFTGVFLNTVTKGGQSSPGFRLTGTTPTTKTGLEKRSSLKKAVKTVYSTYYGFTQAVTGPLAALAAFCSRRQHNKGLNAQKLVHFSMGEMLGWLRNPPEGFGVPERKRNTAKAA